MNDRCVAKTVNSRGRHHRQQSLRNRTYLQLVSFRLIAETHQRPLCSISVLHKESKGLRTHRPRAVFFEGWARGARLTPVGKFHHAGILKHSVMFLPWKIGRELRFGAMPLASAT